MAIKDGLLPEFEKEMAVTRKTLERVPDGDWTWTPHQKSMTLGRLAQHIAELPLWGRVTMTTTELDLSGPFERQTPNTTAELLAVFDANVEGMRGALSAADEEYMKTWTLRMGEKNIFTLPKIAVVRGVVMNHLIHHRAQLGVYFRLKDIPVPATYGPTADDPSGF